MLLQVDLLLSRMRKLVAVVSLEDLLLTEVVYLPGLSLEDLEVEIDQMMVRNSQISKFYDALRTGTLSKGEFETFTDCLFETGIEPDDYIEEMQSNIGSLLESGQYYDY